MTVCHDCVHEQPDGKPLPPTGIAAGAAVMAAEVPLTNPLSWYIKDVPVGVDPADYQAACVRAMARWSSVIPIDYFQAPAGSAKSNLWFYMVQTPAGSGGQGALGPNRGNMWLGVALNTDIGWSLGLLMNKTLMHEEGHTLGLLHSDNPNDVMHPWGANGELSDSDVARVQAIYGKPIGPKTVVGVTGPVKVVVNGKTVYSQAG